MDRSDPAVRRQMWQELDNGWTTTIELMTAVGVYMGLGWLLDSWLGTWPWIMVTGAFLGFGLGTYLAYRRHQQRIESSAPTGRPTPHTSASGRGDDQPEG